MSDKQQMNSVKFRVRDKALLLGKFTIRELVRTTGLKRESVSTEVQRMKKEGLLVTEPLPKSAASKKAKVGARPLLYKLTSDSQKRLEMARQLSSFYMPSVTSEQPTSRHYSTATRLLNRLMEDRQSDESSREDLIRQSTDALNYAWYDENEPEGSVVGAFIERERARLYYVGGNFLDARALFQRAREQFVNASLSEETDKIDSYLGAIQLRQRWARYDSIETPQDRIKEILLVLRSATSNSWAEQPLLALLVSLTERITELQEKKPSKQPAATVAAIAATAAAHGRGIPFRFDIGEDIREGVLRMARSCPIEQYTSAETQSQELVAENPIPGYLTPRYLMLGERYLAPRHLSVAGGLNAHHGELHSKQMREQEETIFSRTIGEHALDRIE